MITATARKVRRHAFFDNAWPFRVSVARPDVEQHPARFVLVTAVEVADVAIVFFVEQVGDVRSILIA
jgi:hypothetical protein